VEDTVKIRCLIKLSKAYIPSNFDSVSYYLDSAYNWAQRSKFREEVANGLNLYGVLAWYKNDMPTAKIYFEDSYNYSKEWELKRQKAKAAGNMGLICNSLGETAEGEPYFIEAIDLYRQLKDTASVSKTQVDFCNNLSDRGFYKEATEHLVEATKYFEKHNKKHDLVFAYFALGDLYYKMGSFDKSLHYFEESMKLEDKDDPTNNISSSLMGIGLLYEKLKQDFDKAEQYYQLALEATNDYNYARVLIGITNNLASIYFQRNEYEKALLQFKLAYKLYQQSSFHSSAIPIALNIGLNYFKLDRLDSARIFYNEGLEKAKQASSIKHIAIAHAHLFQLDSAEGYFLSAIEHLKMKQALNDSLWKQENLDRINELEIQYETDKKEQENRQLKKENELKADLIQNHRTIEIIVALALLLMILLGIWLLRSRKMLKTFNEQLEAQKLELQQLNVTKDKFFSIIAHDLKSPFNSLFGFLELLGEDFDLLSNDEKKEIISNLQESSRNTYNLLLNLLEWTRSQRGYISYTPEKFYLADSVENVFGVLGNRARSKNQKIESDIPNGLKVYSDKMMIESVILNLVNNSIKFTPEGGQISLTAIQQNGHITISIVDNGIGIPVSEQKNLFRIDNDFKRNGTNSELGTGLGLILCNDFVQLMGGTISVESEENKGSVFTVTIPANGTEG
jgi:signal transduction histidine kinase